MGLKYKCLILDHDDTAVNSSATIHFPAHLKVMRLIRPHIAPIDLNGWFLKNFHPGVMNYLSGELKMSDQELQKEYQIWREFTTNRIPQFYPGFLEALSQYRESGGLIAVVSHSEKDIIERNYIFHNECRQFLPDIIFGWHYDEKKRKPSPWPVQEILRTFGLNPEEALIVDDLKPGVLMSLETKVPIAAAGWSHKIPEIQEYMRKQSAGCFRQNYYMT